MVLLVGALSFFLNRFQVSTSHIAGGQVFRALTLKTLKLKAPITNHFSVLPRTPLHRLHAATLAPHRQRKLLVPAAAACCTNDQAPIIVPRAPGDKGALPDGLG